MASHYLFWVSIFLATFIIKEDWRDKKVPLSFLMGFAALSLLHLWGNFSFLTLSLAILVGVVLLHLEKRELIGMADCLLIPCCLLWIASDKIPLFLIISGAVGILTAFYWRQSRCENTYPFTPAILIAWILSITL